MGFLPSFNYLENSEMRFLDYLADLFLFGILSTGLK